MELSEEMQREIFNELYNDTQRFTQQVSMAANQPDHGKRYAILEQLTYISEQMRLKLKMLGAPRIN